MQGSDHSSGKMEEITKTCPNLFLNKYFSFSKPYFKIKVREKMRWYSKREKNQEEQRKGKE